MTSGDKRALEAVKNRYYDKMAKKHKGLPEAEIRKLADDLFREGKEAAEWLNYQRYLANGGVPFKYVD